MQLKYSLFLKKHMYVLYIYFFNSSNVVSERLYMMLPN